MLTASPSLRNIGMTGPSDNQILTGEHSEHNSQLTPDKNVGGLVKLLVIGRLHKAGVVGAVDRLDVGDGEVGGAQRVQFSQVFLTVWYSHLVVPVNINPAQCFNINININRYI